VLGEKCGVNGGIKLLDDMSLCMTIVVIDNNHDRFSWNIFGNSGVEINGAIAATTA
jgi:hypothetical protein